MFRTLLISLCLTSTALATTWTVDDDGKADFDNIQAAVDAASDGDEIVVMPGTYTSTQDGHVVNMLGKAVTLRSSDPSDPDVVGATIIDGEDARRGLACFNQETNKTVIAGFTISNGYSVEFEYGNGSDANQNGGGMFNINSSPTVTDCVFSSNTAVGNRILIGGGGVGNVSCSPTFNRCVFVNNTATGYGFVVGGGGGMGNALSSPVLTDCVFQNNTASGGGAGFGGGLGNINNCFPTLTNCIFTGNTADNGGGMINESSSPTLTDTIVCGNTPDQIYGGWNDNGGNWVADECPIDCPDINGDGYVNVSDLLAIIDQWGLTDSPADVNGDGIVDVTDLLIVVGNWGPCE